MADANSEVREVGATIRAQILSNIEVQKIFDRNRGDTEATLKDLEQQGLIGHLYSTIQKAIDGKNRAQGDDVYDEDVDSGYDNSKDLEMRIATAQSNRNNTSAAKENSTMSKSSSSRATGGGNGITGVAKKPKSGSNTFLSAMKTRISITQSESPILAIHVKSGKAFLDHLEDDGNEDLIDKESLVNRLDENGNKRRKWEDWQLKLIFSFGEHGRKCIQPVDIIGPECEFDEVIHWNCTGITQYERRNLDSFSVFVYRQHKITHNIEVISSMKLRLREGTHQYEMMGCDKKHKLIQGLLTLEVQWLDAGDGLSGDGANDSNTKNREGRNSNSNTTNRKAGSTKNTNPFIPELDDNGQCVDWCSIAAKNKLLRDCFRGLDSFADRVAIHFDKKIDFYAESETGETFPICHFLRLLKGSRVLDSPMHALRFCNLIPSKRNIVFEKRDHLCWHSVEYVFSKGEATPVEKCLILAGILIATWGLDAYVCLGTRLVVNTPIDTSTKNPRAPRKTEEEFCFVLSLGLDQPTLWDPNSGTRFLVSDEKNTLLSVDLAFNHERVYVNPNRYPTDEELFGDVEDNAEQSGFNYNSGAPASMLRQPKAGTSGKFDDRALLERSKNLDELDGHGLNDVKTVSTLHLKRRKRLALARFFNIKSTWIEFKNPLQSETPFELKWGDKLFSAWNVVNDSVKLVGGRKRGLAADVSGEETFFPKSTNNPNLNNLDELHHHLSLNIPEPLQKSCCGSGNIANQIAFVEARIEDVLRIEVENMRRNTGFVGRVKWDRSIESMLSLALWNAEQDRLGISSTTGSEVFDECAKEKFCSGSDTERMLACPAQFNDLRYERYFAQMFKSSRAVQDMLRQDELKWVLRFSCRAKIFCYPENVVAVWIMLAVKKKAP